MTTFVNLTLWEEKIIHAEAFLGNVQIHSSAVNSPIFGNIELSLNFFFVLVRLVDRVLGNFPLCEHFREVGYDDGR